MADRELSAICMGNSMIQLTSTGPVFPASSRDMEKLSGEFDRQRYVKLPALITSGLLQTIQVRIEHAVFEPLTHGKIGTELCLTEDLCVDLLHFLTNTPDFYEFVEHVSGCRPIHSFLGRIYRMIPGAGHFDSWHDDLGEPGRPRLLAMSINLSREVYSGGELQIRERTSEKVVSEIANTGLGDAIVFRIDKSLEHRLTDVRGTAPKTAFAGWFEPGPSLHEILRAALPSAKSSDRDA
jgi:hypothetical protein